MSVAARRVPCFVSRDMHRYRMLVGVSLFLSVAIALSGCVAVSWTDYPGSWAPIQSASTSNGCPRLAGTYSNSGTSALGEEIGASPKLSEVFARLGQGAGLFSPKNSGRTWIVPPEARSLSITQTSESLAVVFISEDKQETPLIFRPYRLNLFDERQDDYFVCHPSDKEPRLQILANPGATTSSFPGIFFASSQSYAMLLSATDGSLIVQWNSEQIGITAIGVGSGVGHGTKWWRYPPSPNFP